MFPLVRANLVQSSGRASSITIILGGSIWYTWIKHTESQASKSGEKDGKYERVPLEDVEAGKVNTSQKPE